MTESTDTFSVIPQPEEVRSRIGYLLRELELSRKLLKVSERSVELRSLGGGDNAVK